jgi:hypothetical protein
MLSPETDFGKRCQFCRQYFPRKALYKHSKECMHSRRSLVPKNASIAPKRLIDQFNSEPARTTTTIDVSDPWYAPPLFSPLDSSEASFIPPPPSSPFPPYSTVERTMEDMALNPPYTQGPPNPSSPMAMQLATSITDEATVIDLSRSAPPPTGSLGSIAPRLRRPQSLNVVPAMNTLNIGRESDSQPQLASPHTVAQIQEVEISSGRSPPQPPIYVSPNWNNHYNE